MTSSHDLISHHLKRHSTKSTTYTYLLLLFLMACSFDAPNLIHLFIRNRLSFITLLKRSQPSFLLSSYYLPICWKTTFLDSIPLGTGSFLQPYNCKPMTGSSYKSTPARSVASYKALDLWNRHAGGENTTCWMQQVRLPGVRLAQLQFDTIAREKLTYCCHTDL